MSSHTDTIDERDLANLAAVRDLHAHLDPMPAGMLERIRFGISVQALHAEVAEIIDSALLVTRSADAPASAEPTPTESVTFTAASVSLMVTAAPVADDDRLVRIDGWVTKGGAEVEAVSSAGSLRAIADEHGRFVIDRVARGPVHFVVRTTPGDPTGRPVLTPSVEL